MRMKVGRVGRVTEDGRLSTNVRNSSHGSGLNGGQGFRSSVAGVDGLDGRHVTSFCMYEKCNAAFKTC